MPHTDDALTLAGSAAHGGSRHDREKPLDTRTLYGLDGSPHVRVDEYMKHRLQNKLIRAILKDNL